MKQSIANIWLLGMIITFILIFACYITITVNYTASFKLKNEVLHIIEKHKGFTDHISSEKKPSVVNSGSQMTVGSGAFQTINMYLRGHHYDARGHCPNEIGEWYGISGLYDDAPMGFGLSASYEPADPNKVYYYCVAKFGTGEINQYTSVYYKVRLFYKFEVPVLSDWLSVKVEGMTDEIFEPESDSLPQSTDQFEQTPGTDPFTT